MSCGPRITSSPGSPGATSFSPVSMSTSRLSVSGKVRPMVPNLFFVWSNTGVHCVTEPGRALHRVRDERAMREHRAFRRAGRAAGVLEEGDVVGAHVRGGIVALQVQDLLERDRAGVALERLPVAVLVLLRERE